MVNPLVASLWNLLSVGNYLQYFIVITNTYFPFGSFYWIIGFTIFMVIQLKSRNMAYASGIAAAFFVTITQTPLVTNVYATLTLMYSGIIFGLIFGYYLYKAIRSNP